MHMTDWPGFFTGTSADMTDVINFALEHASTNNDELIFPAGSVNVGTLVLRTGASIIGDARGGTRFVHLPKGSADASAPMFILAPGTLENIRIENLDLLGQGEMGEDCFSLVPTVPAGASYANLQNVTFDRVRVRNFGGKAFKFAGSFNTPDAAPRFCQFITFRDVLAWRALLPSSRSFSAVGACGQFYFEGACEFDDVHAGSSAPQANSVAVCFSRAFTKGGVIGDAADAMTEAGWTLGGDTAPYRIQLNGTVQGTQYGVLVDRGEIDVIGCYFENVPRAVTVQWSARSIVSNNVFHNSGSGTPAGYILKNSVAFVNHGNNRVSGPRDALYVNDNAQAFTAFAPDL